MLVPRFVGGGRIETAEKPVPKPGLAQLLIRVGANALCGSERGQFQHGSEVTPGHEAAGIVAAAGPDTHTPVGTHGVVFLMGYCGACRSCRLGYTNQCLDKRADMGFNRDGGYGPYELVDESIFFPIDPDIAPTDATLLLDIMGTGGHALRRGSLVHPDIESVLIAGAGPIGLGVLAMARIMFGLTVPVYISDIVPYRLALAERLGGLPIDLRAGSLDAGLARHNAVRVDIAVDTSGRAAARKACLDALAQRGVLVCVGHGEGLELSVSPDLIGPERTVMGSEYFRYDEMPGNLDFFRQHRDYLRQIITHRIAVADIQPAFETFFAGNTGKVVIEQ
jgi:threonine 3-dehydrogenase